MTAIYLRVLPENTNSYSELHRTAYSLLSDAVLIHCGKDISEKDILKTDCGKPYFRDIPLNFSISHCTGHALCAVSDLPIGADCETVRIYRRRTAEYAFTPAECKLIASSAQPDFTFSRMWSLKESFVKFTGTGLAGHLNDAVFLSCDEIPRAVTSYGDRIYFRSFVPREGLIVSVCTFKSADETTIDKITIL